MSLGFTLLLIALFSPGSTTGDAKLYRISEGSISFYSETPVENIEATSKAYAAVINPTTRQVAFSVFINTFDFPNQTMEEHFNENYMESEKYPKGTFSGVINEKIDLLKEGTHQVTVTGKLNIHGVEQERTIPGKIEIKGEKLTLSTDFKVKLVDHKIDVPSLVVTNIAEVIDVKVRGNFALK